MKFWNGGTAGSLTSSRRPYRLAVGLTTRRIAVVLGLLVGAIAAVAPSLALPLAGLIVLTGLWIWSPVAGLAALLMSRSSLDWFQDATRDQQAFLVNPASALGIVLIALALTLAGLKLRNRQRIEWGGRPGLAWGGFVLVSGLGVAVALLQLGGPVFSAAVREYVRLLSLFAIYFLVVNLASDARSRSLLLGATLLGIAIPLVVGAYQMVTGTSIHQVDGVQRIYGTFVHPNSFGMYLVAITMIALGLWQDRFGGSRARWQLALIILLAVTALIFTYSRSSLGILLFALLLWGMTGSRRRQLFFGGGVVATGLALAPLLSWRFADLLNTGDPAMERTNSFVWRLLNYRQLLEVFAESPIVGHGLRAAGFVNPITTASAEGYERGFAAHNELIRVLVEQGLVGLLAYLAMAALFLSTFRRPPTGGLPGRSFQFPGLARAFYALLLSYFILCMIGSELLSYTGVLYVVLTVAGVLYGSRESSGRIGPIDSAANPRT